MNGKRWLIGLPIVSFWLVMMGLLLRGELGGRPLAADAYPAEHLETPTDSWLGISLAEGPRVGFVHLRQEPEARHDLAGIRMSLDARMKVDLLGKSTALDLEGWVWRAAASPRLELDFAVRSSGHEFRIAGQVADGALSARVTSAGESLPLDLPVDADLIFSSGLGPALRFPRLEVGDTVWLDSFDPLTLAKSRSRVTCTAREVLRLAGAEVPTCRLTITTHGLASLAWIDDRGEVVRAETPVGLVLERISPAEARLAAPGQGDAADSADFLDRTAIRPTGRRPFRTARSMTVRLGGDLDLALPADRVQTALGGGRFRLSVPAEPVGQRLAGNGGASGRYLAADAFVQSDHPRIRDQAAAIVGSEADPWQRARRIHDWVFSRLDKEAVLSIPSALEVLAERRGDCNEHAVLFTALARAAGLPTRIAIGVVWSDELEGFYYHAWPEVHLGDWVWMDPTLGQPLADATHIKLLNGGIESWPRLLPYLGKLEVEVLDVG